MLITRFVFGLPVLTIASHINHEGTWLKAPRVYTFTYTALLRSTRRYHLNLFIHVHVNVYQPFHTTLIKTKKARTLFIPSHRDDKPSSKKSVHHNEYIITISLFVSLLPALFISIFSTVQARDIMLRAISHLHAVLHPISWTALILFGHIYKNISKEKLISFFQQRSLLYDECPEGRILRVSQPFC
jgi:hypothetical protein